jgi:hypothetical protein
LLSLRSEKIKTHALAVNRVSILTIGRIMTSIKDDSIVLNKGINNNNNNNNNNNIVFKHPVALP